MILHWCEACDREETLDPEDAYELGWDFPPKMGSLGIVSPRTCPYCYIDKTAWFAAMTNKPLTERHRKTIERIQGEEVSKCPRCGTAATYQLGKNSFGCKCTYEAETGEQE